MGKRDPNIQNIPFHTEEGKKVGEAYQRWLGIEWEECYKCGARIDPFAQECDNCGTPVLVFSGEPEYDNDDAHQEEGRVEL